MVSCGVGFGLFVGWRSSCGEAWTLFVSSALVVTVDAET